jgi:hypothetical protein
VKAESRSIWMATESTMAFSDWRFENFPKWWKKVLTTGGKCGIMSM